MLYYQAKNLILVPLATISLLVAATGLSIIPVHSLGTGWEAAPLYGSDFFIHSIAWRLLVISLLFLTISLIVGWQSEIRYHFSLFSFLSLSLFCFLSLGLLSYYSGLAKAADASLSASRTYSFLLGDRNAAWKHPELGLLSGQVAASQEADTVRLIGFDQRAWLLDISDLSPETRLLLETGKDYRLIGQDRGDSRFEVESFYAYED